MCEYRNIYQTARLNTGFTQEFVSERIGISVESLRKYETGQRRPPDAVVWRMATLYSSMLLCYQHLASGALGGMLPDVRQKSLEQATLRFVRLFGEFAKSGHLDQLMEINEDGIITAEERPLHDAIMAELQELTTTYLELGCAAQKESAQSGGNRD